MPTYDAIPCRVGCGHVWCPNCGRTYALLVRDRLRKADEAFRAKGLKALLISLTVDASKAHLEEPGEAFCYLRDKKAVAFAMKRWIRSRCPAAKGHWFRALELQQRGYVHYHILVYVPADFEIQKPWRPTPEAPPIGGEFDAFWSHGFSNVREDFQQHDYVTKAVPYITDVSGAECAEWLRVVERARLPRKGVHIFQAARGFWANAGVEEPPASPQPEWSDHEMIDEETGDVAESIDAPPAAEYLSDRISHCRVRSCIRVVDHDSGRTVAAVNVEHSRKVLAVTMCEERPDVAVFYEDSGNLYGLMGLSFRELVNLVDHFDAMGMRMSEGAADKLAERLRCYSRDRWATSSYAEHPQRTKHLSVSDSGAANVGSRGQTVSALWL